MTSKTISVSLELRGATYSAELTDADADAILTLAFFSEEEMKLSGQGRRLEAHDRLKARLEGRVRDIQSEGKMLLEANEQATQELGQSMYERSKNDAKVYSALAFLLQNLFSTPDAPGLPRSLVWYVSETHCRILLTIEERMQVFLGIIGPILNKKADEEKAAEEAKKADEEKAAEEAKKAIEAAKPEGKKAIVPVVLPPAEDEEMDDKFYQIEMLKAQKRRAEEERQRLDEALARMEAINL